MKDYKIISVDDLEVIDDAKQLVKNGVFLSESEALDFVLRCRANIDLFAVLNDLVTQAEVQRDLLLRIAVALESIENLT